MKEANFNLSSLGAARHSPQKGKARMQCFRTTLLAELALKRQFDKGSRYRSFFRAFLLQWKKRKKGKQG